MAKIKTKSKSKVSLIIGISILAVVLVLATKLVQKNQENRSKAASSTNPSWCTQVYKCDLDKDGKITSADANELLSVVSSGIGTTKLTSLIMTACDINQDKKITSVDALMIQQVAKGKVCNNVTVTPTPSGKVNGACGSANGLPTATAPTTNLCNSGQISSSGVTLAGNIFFLWACNGVETGSQSIACYAPKKDCEHGDKRCYDKKLFRCRNDQTGWELEKDCGIEFGCNATTKECNTCPYDGKRCYENDLLRCRNDRTGWELEKNCGVQLGCNATTKECNTCPPDGRRCYGNDLLKCRSDRTGWELMDICPNGCNSTTNTCNY